jgi:YhcH/YjgK/YiaL family protein
MIIDTLVNASKYYSIHPLLAKAFQYIQQTNLDAIEMGKNEIDGENLKATFSNKKGMTAAESIAKFECHNKHIDINFVQTASSKSAETQGEMQSGEWGYNAKRMYSCIMKHPTCIFS